MITLSQMQLLEQKIESAIAKITALSDENNALRVSNSAIKSENDSLKDENDALAAKLSELQSSQAKIEQGILKALHRLEAVENTIIETVNNSSLQSAARPVPKQAVLNAPAVNPPAEDDEYAPESDGEKEGGEGEAAGETQDGTERIGGPAQQLDIF